MIKKQHLLLILILILAGILRLWKLDKLPSGFTWDEAALGYDAYSLLKTGHDQHNAVLPIIFKSFGDYKPGFYIYLTIPSIVLFGLTEFAVRLPSAIFGILSVYGIYLLANELFPKFSVNKSFPIGILAALALSLNPWHIHFSRGAWEVNVFVTLLLFSIYFFVRSLSDKKYLWLSLISALLTFFTYQAAKMLTPLVFLSLLLIYRKQVKSSVNNWLSFKLNIAALIVSFFGALWLLYLTSTGPAGNRLAVLNIFGYRPGITSEQIKTDNNDVSIAAFFHNQLDLTSRMVAGRYLNHFSPEVMLYEGPVITERGHLPRMGMLYLLDIVWLIAGFFAVSKIKDSYSRNTLLALLLIAPIPASLTLAEFSTVRALFMTIPLCLLISIGFVWLVNNLSKFVVVPLILIYMFNVFLGLDLYFNHANLVLAKEFNYGERQAVQEIINHPADRVVYTDLHGQPYIYYLFYTRFDPAEYQKLNVFIDQGLDVGRVQQLKNVEFHQFEKKDILSQKNTLFIGTPDNIVDNFDYQIPEVEYHSQIKAPDDSTVYRVIKTVQR